MVAAVKKTRKKAPLPPGPGRPKGSKNKVPADLKQALQLALDGFAPRIPELLEKVAAKDPARALELVGKLGDFIVPRRSRIQVHGASGQTWAELVAGSGAPIPTEARRPIEAEPVPATSYQVIEPVRPLEPVAPAPVAAPSPAPAAAPTNAPPREQGGVQYRPHRPLLEVGGIAKTDYDPFHNC